MKRALLVALVLAPSSLPRLCEEVALWRVALRSSRQVWRLRVFERRGVDWRLWAMPSRRGCQLLLLLPLLLLLRRPPVLLGLRALLRVKV